MSNELTDVRCPCGAEFQADSYDAGFIAGSGMCQNCGAALPPKDICTCPSGDGSLRWPCPKHPAVEQAGTNVGHGHVFPRADGVKMRCGGPGLCSECAADAYRARAALAQPSPKCATCNDQCAPLNANDELMNVAQHAASVARWAEMFNRVEQERDAALAEVERIKTISDNYYVLCVERQQQLDAALAEVERLRESKGDPSGSFDRCMKMMYERDENAKRLDAALARVAELEKGTVYVEARQCDECQHVGINDSADGLAACHDCDWTGPEPDEDKCPDCQRENCMAAACPQCGARYVLVASEEIAAPVAQAQHSVPDVCDEKEQDAFEQWARKEGLDTSCHPMHWLFLDAKTNSARQGWKAALRYVRSQLAAAPQPVAEGE
ncbi:TPA: hypothetical protein VDW60_006519 [Pseudomonas aeruginosa]|nr:hypothetical protein [Pseudomonas aeruginosa]HEQ0030069.1 hypothetical protein [Pseudomonas aeruginosa]